MQKKDSARGLLNITLVVRFEADLCGSDSIIDLHFQRLEAPWVLLCQQLAVGRGIREMAHCATKLIIIIFYYVSLSCRYLPLILLVLMRRR